MNVLELFCGCGGLAEGFLKNTSYKTLACVDWDYKATNILKNRIRDSHPDYNTDIVLTKDIQNFTDLMNNKDGLSNLIKKKKIDIIIGGPPCQSYSVAGRIRDADGMRNDYRNYLFEAYLDVVNYYKPKFFIFENVPGIFSAKPGDGRINIIEDIKRQFAESGYLIHKDKKTLLVEMSDYGVPQSRKRAIILGIRKDCFINSELILDKFYYDILPNYKEKKQTVKETICDLPAFYPAKKEYRYKGKSFSHTFEENLLNWNHYPRYHNKRDIAIFKELAYDIAIGENKYTSASSLIELYFRKTGKKTNVHKYHVLRSNDISNTIPAHLYKDGLRHIHPDYKQARSITVREAARLQTFPDDYIFNNYNNQDFMYIGNAVPPKFSLKLSRALIDLDQFISSKHIEVNAESKTITN